MDYLQVLRFLKRRDTLILSVASAVFILFLVVSQLSESRYRSSAKLIIYPPPTTSNAQQTMSSTDWRTDFATLKTFMLSQTFLERTATRVADRAVSWTSIKTATALNSLSGQPGQTTIVQVDVTTNSPDRSRKIADALSHELIDFVPIFSAEELTRNAEFLEKMVATAELNLKEAEANLAAWQKKHHAVDASAAHSDYAANLSKLQTRGELAAQEVRNLQERVRQLSAFVAAPSTEVPPWLVLEDKSEHIQQLQQSLAQKQARLEQLKGLYHAGEPVLAEAAADVDTAQHILQQQIQLEARSLLSERQAQLADAKGTVDSIVRGEKIVNGSYQLSEDNLEYSKLSRQITAQQADYNALREQYEAALIQEQNAKREGSIRVLEEPVPGVLVPSLLGNDLRQVLPLILPVSLIAGLLVAYTVERLSDNTIRVVIESTLDLPIVGVIPLLPTRVVASWEEMRQSLGVAAVPMTLAEVEANASDMSSN